MTANWINQYLYELKAAMLYSSVLKNGLGLVNFFWDALILSIFQALRNWVIHRIL